MKIHAECEIRAPKEKVFRVFSDLENLSKNVQAITHVEVLTPGEFGVGTRFKETRVMFGKETSEVMEVRAYSPPDSFEEEARSGGLHYVSLWRFAEKDGVTTVSIDFSGTAETFTAKILSILFSFMAGSMKKAFLADMDDLKKILES